jgi:hypothetical protein
MKTVKVLLGHTMNYSALSSYKFSIEVQNAVVSIQIMKLTIAKASRPDQEILKQPWAISEV